MDIEQLEKLPFLTPIEVKDHHQQECNLLGLKGVEVWFQLNGGSSIFTCHHSGASLPLPKIVKGQPIYAREHGDKKWRAKIFSGWTHSKKPMVINNSWYETSGIILDEFCLPTKTDLKKAGYLDHEIDHFITANPGEPYGKPL